MPAGNCTCKHSSQHKMGNLSYSGQYAGKVVHASCAAALLGTWCRARRSACGYSAWCFGKSSPEVHCIQGPILPGKLLLEGLRSLQSLACSLSLCTLSAFWTARSVADPAVGCYTPPVATGITEPISRLIALCHHTVRCTIIYFIVPLSRDQRSLGGQRVVLAHFAAAVLGTTIASGSIADTRFPAVRVAIWTLITFPPDLPSAVLFDVNAA